METLYDIVKNKWEEQHKLFRPNVDDFLEEKNSVKDITPEMVKADLKLNILELPILSRYITTEEDLSKLSRRLHENLPSPRVFSDIRDYVNEVEGLSIILAKNYGIQANEQDLQEREFVAFADFSDIDKKAQIELRILPDHPKHSEVLDRLIELHSYRMNLGNKYKAYSGPLALYLPAGFESWKGAVQFGNYCHMSPEKKVCEKQSTDETAIENAKRYFRFKLITDEAVKEISPTMLLKVDKMFGDAGARYVDGDISSFKELLGYADINGKSKTNGMTMKGLSKKDKSDMAW